MKQQRIALICYPNVSIVMSPGTGSSPFVRTMLGLHVLQTYSY